MQIDIESLLDVINDINKQLLEIRSEISYLKGYVTSMNNHQYPPVTVPPYQVWMNTDSHQPKTMPKVMSVPCKTGDLKE